MKKIKILAIAPYEGMAETLSVLSENRRDIEMTIHTGNLQTGLDIARSLTAQREYDVIISRGGTAELIQRELDLLVIDAPLSVYDILRSIKMAENYAGKYAIAGFHSITSNARILCDLLQLNIDIFTFQSQEDVPSILQQLKQQSYTLVICDMIGTLTAQSIGLNSIFIPSGKESINAAIDEAVKIVRSSMHTYKEKEIFKAAITNDNEAVLIYDSTGSLWFSNLSSSAFDQHLLNMAKTYLPAFTKTNHQTFLRKVDGMNCQITNENISYDNKNYTLLKINKKAPLFEENDKTIAIYNDFDKAAPSTIARQSSANFIGNVHHLIEKYSPTNFPILITGETGTGKEKAAALLCKNGPYSNKPYFVIDCSLLNDKKWNTLLKSENSPLNSVHTTIHIKDLGKLSPSNRTKLYTYVKDTGLLKRSRLIFSLITPDENAGEITNYLINRMSCLLLPIPPLRERSEDLSSIATLYVNQMNALLSKQIVGFSNDAFDLIRQYHWPNNLDQFHRVLREAAALTDGSYITNDIVQMLLNQEQEVCDQSHFAQLSSQLDLTKTLDEITYDIIRTVLAEEHNSKEKTAKRLGIGRSTLWRILKNHHGN